MGMPFRIALIKESEDMARTAEDLGDCQGFKAGAAAAVACWMLAFPESL